MLKAEDTHALRIPLGIYPSKDEPFDEVRLTITSSRFTHFLRRISANSTKRSSTSSG